MSSRPWDVRLRKITWDPVPKTVSVKTRVRIMLKTSATISRPYR